MVLEAIYSIKTIIKKPLYMLALSFITTIVCIFTSYFIFPLYSGVIFTLLITVAFAPLMYKVFSVEEDLDAKASAGKSKLTFIERHGEVIKIFSFFFLGTFLATFLIAIVLDEGLIGAIFSQQISEIQAIRSISTGSVVAIPKILEIIFFNNIRVMFFSFLLSFLIGTGAIFILSWNASILALFLSNFIRQGMFSNFLLYTSGIFPHAIIEILAYFLAGIAGGIISVGTVREEFMSKEFIYVVKDATILILLAVFAVGLGAAVEVWF